MQVDCFVIREHLVVIKSELGNAQYHYVRGEKSTRIDSWNIEQWKKFKVYLLGSMGISSISKLEMSVFSFLGYSNTDDMFKAVFPTATKKDIYLLLKEKVLKKRQTLHSDKLVFNPLSGEITLNQKCLPLLDLVTQKKTAAQNKSKLITAKFDTSSKNIKRTEPGGIWMKPFYDNSEFNEVLKSMTNDETEGLVMRVSGSGFYVYVEGVSLYIQKRKLRTVIFKINSNHKIKKNYTMPKNGDVLPVIYNSEKNCLMVNLAGE